MSENSIAQDSVRQPGQHGHLYSSNNFSRRLPDRGEAEDAIGFRIDKSFLEAARLR